MVRRRHLGKKIVEGKVALVGIPAFWQSPFYNSSTLRTVSGTSSLTVYLL